MENNILFLIHTQSSILNLQVLYESPKLITFELNSNGVVLDDTTHFVSKEIKHFN